jgi:hypothetical protein
MEGTRIDASSPLASPDTETAATRPTLENFGRSRTIWVKKGSFRPGSIFPTAVSPPPALPDTESRAYALDACHDHVLEITASADSVISDAEDTASIFVCANTQKVWRRKQKVSQENQSDINNCSEGFAAPREVSANPSAVSKRYISAMPLVDRPHPLIIQRSFGSEVQVVIAGLVIKILLLPNVKLDNSYSVNFSLDRNFFKSCAGKRFATEEVDSNFIFGGNVFGNSDSVSGFSLVDTQDAGSFLIRDGGLLDFARGMGQLDAARTREERSNVIISEMEPDADMNLMTLIDEVQHNSDVSLVMGEDASRNSADSGSVEVIVPGSGRSVEAISNSGRSVEFQGLNNADHSKQLQIMPSLSRASSSTKRVKVTTPATVAGMRRGLRSDKDGYVAVSLPYGPSRRKASQVPLAPTPAVLQIQEMQRIGVEDCGVDPMDITEEKLRRERGS